MSHIPADLHKVVVERADGRFEYRGLAHAAILLRRDGALHGRYDPTALRTDAAGVSGQVVAAPAAMAGRD